MMPSKRLQKQQGPPGRSAARWAVPLAVLSFLFVVSSVFGTTVPDRALLSSQAAEAREAGRLDEAIQLYSRLSGLDPQCGEAWWYVGALRYEAASYELALTALKHLLLLEPENGQAWGLLGLCEYELGSEAEALAHLAKARLLGFSGNDDLARVVRFHHALLLIRGRQFEAALAILDGFAAENRPSAGVFEAMGLAVLRISEPKSHLPAERLELARLFGQAAFLEGAQRTDESIEVYLRLAKRFDGVPNVAYAVGVAWLARGDPEQARPFFEKELSRDPNHVPALIRLAEDGISSNRLEDALVLALRAVAQDPELLEACFVLGRAYLLAGRVPNAIVELERAARLAPGAPSVYYLLAQAYARAGQAQEAKWARDQFSALSQTGK